MRPHGYARSRRLDLGEPHRCARGRAGHGIATLAETGIELLSPLDKLATHLLCDSAGICLIRRHSHKPRHLPQVRRWADPRAAGRQVQPGRRWRAPRVPAQRVALCRGERGHDLGLLGLGQPRDRRSRQPLSLSMGDCREVREPPRMLANARLEPGLRRSPPRCPPSCQAAKEIFCAAPSSSTAGPDAAGNRYRVPCPAGRRHRHLTALAVATFFGILHLGLLPPGLPLGQPASKAPPCGAQH